jgi:hypothetical protein
MQMPKAIWAAQFSKKTSFWASNCDFKVLFYLNSIFFFFFLNAMIEQNNFFHSYH